MVQPAGGLPTYDPNANPPNSSYLPQQGANTYTGGTLGEGVDYTPRHSGVSFGPNGIDYGTSGGLAMGYGGNLRPGWAGSSHGATDTANALANKGQSFQGRTAPTLMNAYVARGQMQSVIDRNRERAGLDTLHDLSEGRGPSAAMVGMGAAQDQNLASKVAAAHMGGGLGGARAMQAGAQQDQAAMAGGATGVLGETNRAGNAYMAGMNQLVGEDLHQRGLDQGFATDQARMNAAQAQQNDSMQLAYQQMGENTMEAQLDADTRGYGSALGDQSMSSIANYNNSADLSNKLIAGGASAGAGWLKTASQGRKPASSDDAPGPSGHFDYDEYVSDYRLKEDVRPQLASTLRGYHG